MYAPDEEGLTLTYYTCCSLEGCPDFPTQQLVVIRFILLSMIWWHASLMMAAFVIMSILIDE